MSLNYLKSSSKPREIVRVLQGKLTVYMADDTIHVEKDGIVFINQEIVHGYEPEGCTYEVINLDLNAILLRTSLCKKILHTLANDKIYILPFDPIKNADLYQITNRLFEIASQQADDNDLLLLSTLFELLGTIYVQHHYTENLYVSKNANRFKPLLDYIDVSFMNPITSSEMATISGMSLNHFSEAFRN